MAKYPRGSLKLDPRHRRPDCPEEAYKAALVEGIQAAKAGKPRDACPYDAAQDRRADAWLAGWSPSLTMDDVQALNGRHFASLTPSELEQLNYFRKRGRKWGITIGFGTSMLNSMELLQAPTEHATDDVLRRADAVVTIHCYDPIMGRRTRRAM